MFTVGQGMGTLRPLVLLSPIIAETIATAGWSKADVKQYLFEHARMPAHEFERILRDWNSRSRSGTSKDEVAPRPHSEGRSSSPTIRTAWCRSCGSRTIT